MRPLAASLLLLFATTVQAEFLIVVSETSPITELSEKEVANIFLARTNHLDMIGRVQPLELDNQAQHEAFYRRIAGKSPAQINSYWTTLIFTGKGKPPREVKGRDALMEELARNPGAITYLPGEAVGSGLRVVFTLP